MPCGSGAQKGQRWRPCPSAPVSDRVSARQTRADGRTGSWTAGRHSVWVVRWLRFPAWAVGGAAAGGMRHRSAVCRAVNELFVDEFVEPQIRELAPETRVL